MFAFYFLSQGHIGQSVVIILNHRIIFGIQYLIDHPDKILIPLLETVQLTLITLVISVALAALLTILAVKFPKLGYALIQLFSMIYSIPSLAVFALLIPLTGIGKKTAIIVLVIYNQYLLLRNFVTGINEVDPAVVEAARGIGLTDMQTLFKVQVPLAKVALYAGIRLAAELTGSRSASAPSLPLSTRAVSATCSSKGCAR